MVGRLGVVGLLLVGLLLDCLPLGVDGLLFQEDEESGLLFQEESDWESDP